MTQFRTQKSDGNRAGEIYLGPTARSPFTFASEIQSAHSTPAGDNDLDSHIDALQSADIQAAVDLVAAVATNRWKGEYANNTQYAADDEVKRNTSYYRRNNAGNSGATFNASDWTELSGAALDSAQFHERFAEAHGNATAAEPLIEAWISRIVDLDRWQGAWEAGTTYAVDDYTESGGGFYRRLSAGSDSSTEDPASNPSDWAQLTGLELKAVQRLKTIADLAQYEEFKGAWTTVATGFGFKQGDIVEHPIAGGALRVFYICYNGHDKATNAPDLDTGNWHLLAPVYQGAHVDSWYHQGAIVLHSAAFWMANEHVVRGDPAPGSSSNTKWLDMAGAAVTKSRVYARNKDIFRAGSHVVMTPDDTAETITIGATGGTDSFEREKTDGTVRWTATAGQHYVSIPLHGLEQGDRIELQGTVTPPHGATVTGMYWQATAPSNGYALTPANVVDEDTVSSRAGYLQTGQVRIGTQGQAPTGIGEMPGGIRDTGTDALTSSTFIEALRDLDSVTVYLVVVGQGPGVNAVATAQAFAPSPVSQEVGFYSARNVLEAGENIQLTPDPERNKIGISAPSSRPTAPEVVNSFWGRGYDQDVEVAQAMRLRSIDSNDLRTAPAAAYSITRGSTGSLNLTGSTRDIDFFHEGNPDGWDATRPNLGYGAHGFRAEGGLVIGGYFHMTNVDFSAANAGSTTREFDVTIELTPANERNYGDDETLEVWLVHDVPRISNRLVLPGHHTFHYDGGHQGKFKHTFRVTMTGAPRTQDYFQIRARAHFGAQKNVTAQHINAFSLTFSLPHAGVNVVETYPIFDANNQVHWDGSAREIPLTNPWLVNFAQPEIPSAEGASTAPGQTDKAEVDSTFHPSDPSSTVPQILMAQRDLRRVKLNIDSTATSTVPDTVRVWLVTWAEGVLDPQVVDHFDIVRGSYSKEILLDGVLEGQTFMLLANKRIWANNADSTRPHFGNIGSPKLKWDVSIKPSLGSTYQVIPGLIETRIVEFNNNDAAKTVGNINQLPPVEKWLSVHLRSNGVEATVEIPPGYEPAATFGAPSDDHPAIIGAAHRSQNRTGSITSNKLMGVILDTTQDPAVYQLGFWGTDGGREQSPWIGQVHIDYIR